MRKVMTWIAATSRTLVKFPEMEPPKALHAAVVTDRNCLTGLAARADVVGSSDITAQASTKTPIMNPRTRTIDTCFIASSPHANQVTVPIVWSERSEFV